MGDAKQGLATAILREAHGLERAAQTGIAPVVALAVARKFVELAMDVARLEGRVGALEESLDRQAEEQRRIHEETMARIASFQTGGGA